METLFIKEDWKQSRRSFMKRDIFLPVKSKTRILLFVVLMLWIAVFLQMAVERLFMKKETMSEAFSELRTEENVGTVSVTAIYPSNFLSEYDKKQLIYVLAEEIGLEVEEEPSVFYADNRCEVWYEKEAVRAHTLLKVISIRQDGVEEHLLYAKLSIQEKTAKSAVFYQERLRDAFEELGAEQISVTLELSGEQQGQLSLEKKNTLTNALLESLSARTVYENRDNVYYTVYAYTGRIDEYIMVEGKKINVQVAVFYDREENVTKIYVATPMLES